MTRHAATPVTFAPLKYGQLLAVDSTSVPRWTGIVPDGQHHVLDFHEFLVVSTGKARITVNGTTSTVEGPTVFVTPPHVVRRVEIIDPMRVELVVCSSKALRHGGWIAALQGMRAGPMSVNRPEITSSLVESAQNIQAELRAPRPDTGLLLDALVTQFLIALNRSSVRAAETATSPLVDRFESLVEHSFRLHHNVGYYANALAVTPDYLSSITRSRCGVSAKTMLDRRICAEAARLLTQTRNPIAVVAASLGFDEPSHFTRFMTRMSGVAPSGYRRNKTNRGNRQAHSGN